jgi:hypothetical protein
MPVHKGDVARLIPTLPHIRLHSGAIYKGLLQLRMQCGGTPHFSANLESRIIKLSSFIINIFYTNIYIYIYIFVYTYIVR